MSAGKISWFGGPNDAMSGPTTASGAPVTKPGVAYYSHATLGGYWLFELPPNGRRVVLQQTDYGPAPWTGRTWDFTSSALAAIGYSEKTFPTDAIAHGRYLGRTVPANLRQLLVTDRSAPVTRGAGGNVTSSASSNPITKHGSGAMRALLTIALISAGATLAYIGLAHTAGIQHPVRTPASVAGAAAVAAPK